MKDVLSVLSEPENVFFVFTVTDKYNDLFFGCVNGWEFFQSKVENFLTSLSLKNPYFKITLGKSPSLFVPLDGRAPKV